MCLESVFIECLFLYIFRERERDTGRHTVEDILWKALEDIYVSMYVHIRWKTHSGRHILEGIVTYSLLQLMLSFRSNCTLESSLC